MFKPPLSSKNGELYVEDVSFIRLAEEFDTPLYVISENKIREQFRKLSSALSENYEKHRIFFSAKSNTNQSVLKILREEGSFLDVVSPGEVFLALEAGFKPDRILFTGTSVRDDELEYLLDKEVIMNVDSLSQLSRLLRLSVPELLSFRINPELGAGHHDHVITAGEKSKFGIWEEDAVKAYDEAKRAGVSRFGIQMHIGSGVLNFEPYLQPVDKLLSIAKRIRDSVGITFEFVDFGGGLGVPYRPEEQEMDVDLFVSELVKLFERRTRENSLGSPELWLEPGRYLVAEAGVLLTRINTIKFNPFRRFAGVDAGFNTLIRPILYDSYHPIVVANKADQTPRDSYDIVGPICETGDAMAKDRPMPRLEEGDLLAILNAGAYGFSMSSQYNSRPRAAEVLVRGGDYRLIRERESFQDLLRGQMTPEWLKK